MIPTYRRLGLEALGEKADDAALAADFNWPAVMEGFEEVSTMDYRRHAGAFEETPDGTPGENVPCFRRRRWADSKRKIAGQPVPDGAPGRRRGASGERASIATIRRRCKFA